MRFLNSNRIALGVLSSAILSVLVMACTAPTKLKATGEGFGVKFEVAVDANGHSVTRLMGSLPAGQCIKIECRGANGELLGTDTVHVPGSSQIPTSAKSQSFSIVDCPDESGTIAPTGMGAHAHQAIAYTTWIEISSSPIVPDLVDGGIYRNAIYHFRVKAAPGLDPFARIEPILRGGPGTPVPPDVDVLSFTQFLPEASGGRMIVADTAAFDQFRLDRNGQVGYADLATGTNVFLHGAGNQWEVIESLIPVQDFLQLIGETNHAVTVRSTVPDTVSEVVDYAVTQLAF